MERRTRYEDLQNELEQQTMNLAPERWNLLYRDKLLGISGLPNDEGEIQIGVDELNELDQYMESQEQKFQEIISGKHTLRGDSPTDYRSQQADEMVWGPWR